jgi:hypothetical protein
LAAERNVESTGYLVAESNRIVRGMTWSGYFYNLVTPKPAVPAAGNSAVSYTVRSSDRRSEQSQTGNKRELFSGTNTEAVNDDALTLVSRSLAELHDISLAMGESLDRQNQGLERLDQKTEKTHDDTIQVLLKSSLLIHYNKSSKPIMIGEYCFVVSHPGGYLGVSGDSICIVSHIDLSSTFRCYIKDDNLYGLQSSLTFKFLSTGYFTAISYHESDLTKSSMCHIDMSGAETGIFMMDCNWGGGGWIKILSADGGFGLGNGIHDKSSRLLVTPALLTPVTK